MLDANQVGLIRMEFVAQRCYLKFIKFVAGASYPENSLYIPRDVFPNDQFPYRLAVTIKSAEGTHWKHFREDTWI